MNLIINNSQFNKTQSLGFKGAIKIPSANLAESKIKAIKDIAFQPSVKLVEVAEPEAGIHLNLHFYTSDIEKQAVRIFKKLGIEHKHLKKPDLTPKEFDEFVSQSYKEI